MAETNLDELLSAVDAARYLGITPARIYVLAKQGRLGRLVGGYWLFTRAELDDYKATPKSRGGRPKKAAGPLTVARPA